MRETMHVLILYKLPSEFVSATYRAKQNGTLLCGGDVAKHAKHPDPYKLALGLDVGALLLVSEPIEVESIPERIELPEDADLLDLEELVKLNPGSFPILTTSVFEEALADIAAEVNDRIEQLGPYQTDIQQIEARSSDEMFGPASIITDSLSGRLYSIGYGV